MKKIAASLCLKAGEINQMLAQSVLKALRILEYINQNGESGIREASDALNLDKSTVYRLVTTLMHQKYLQQNPENNKYSCTLKLFEMGMRLPESMGIDRQMRMLLEDLADETGESVNLGILHERDVVHVDKVESSEIIKVDMGVGAKLPAYATALGKAILAYLPEKRVRNLFEGYNFEQRTPNTLACLDDLLLQLVVIREKGYATDLEEYSFGLSCIAAPVRDRNGNVLAAVSVAFLTYRFPKVRQEEKLVVKKLSSIAEKISLVFKYGGGPVF